MATDNVSALLRCGQLTFNLPAVGDHPANVVAESKIMINYRDEKNVFYHITAARAVYDYNVAQSVTNELVTLTGSPKVEWGDANQLTGVTNLLAEDSDSLTNALPNWLIGEPIYYARVNGGKGSFQANHQQIHIEPHTSGTNASPMPAKLF